MKFIPAVLAASLIACGGTEAPKKPAAPTCAMNVGQLDGQTFILLKSMGGNKYAYWPRARMKFSGTGADTTVRYSTDHLVHVFDYECDLKDADTLECRTKPFYGEICRALEVSKMDSCSADAIHALGFKGHEEDLDKVITEAKAEVAKYRGTANWDTYQMSHDNVANGVQGLLRIKINEKRCRLTVTDLNLVVLHGQLQESMTLIGESDFVKTDDELLFEDCTNEVVLADTEEATLPKDLTTLQRFVQHNPGKEVHYFYLGDVAAKAEEGCTYSADLYGSYKPLQKDIVVTPEEDGRLLWHTSHTWTDDDRNALASGKNGAVVELVRSKTCGGTETIIDTVCNYTIF